MSLSCRTYHSKEIRDEDGSIERLADSVSNSEPHPHSPLPPTKFLDPTKVPLPASPFPSAPPGLRFPTLKIALPQPDPRLSENSRLPAERVLGQGAFALPQRFRHVRLHVHHIRVVFVFRLDGQHHHPLRLFVLFCTIQPFCDDSIFFQHRVFLRGLSAHDHGRTQHSIILLRAEADRDLSLGEMRRRLREKFLSQEGVALSDSISPTAFSDPALVEKIASEEDWAHLRASLDPREPHAAGCGCFFMIHEFHDWI
ncbi:hypothetical protein B0H14DRAFT_3851197 [Mycena olivaceomarginata]|nr:hypothetical protein B0H14DRAFT_3851197 [Mycena olivaceomarginata]